MTDEMYHRCMHLRYPVVLLIAAAAMGGCANRPTPLMNRPEHSEFGWEGNAGLTLDQIGAAPKLKPPTTLATDRPPVAALELYGKARDALLRGQTQMAIELLQRSIELDPYRFALRYDLGWAFVNANGSDEKAISAFEKAELLDPDHLNLQTELGKLYLLKSNKLQAIRHLQLATQTSEYSNDDGKAAVVDFYLGKALKEAGYDRAALNQYSVLLKRFENPSLALQQNSELAYLLDRQDSLFVEIGELLEKHGEYASAVRSFQPAVDRQPDNFELQARFAKDLALDDQREAALGKSVDLIVRNRASPTSLKLLKDVCRTLKMDDGVVATLRKLTADRPGDKAVLFALADTLVARNRSAEARSLLEAAWEKSPAEIAITRRVFSLDMRARAISSAAALLVHALAVNPDALHSYARLWLQLLRPGLSHRFKLASVLEMKVLPSDEAARQFWAAMTAADDGRPAASRAAMEASARQLPPFAPAFRGLLSLNWERADQSQADKISAGDQLAAAAKAGGDLSLAAELEGRSLVRQAKRSAAIDQFTMAIRAGGRSAELILAGIDASRTPGRDAKYEAMLWDLISDRPMFENGYIDLFAYYTDGDPPQIEQAMKLLSTWLVNDPRSVSAQVLQVDLQMQAGQMNDAQLGLDRLSDDDAEDPETFGVLHKFYSRTGRLNDLTARLEREREIDPRDTDLVGRLAGLYADQKRNAEAIRLLDGTRALVADDPDLLYSLTSYYAQLGQNQAASDILEQVVQLDPYLAGACNDLGFDWADEGKNLARAEALIRVAIAAEPDNASFLDSLGWVLYKRGKFGEAREYLLSAIGTAAFPDPVVLDHLGDTLCRLASTDDALKAWRQSLSDLGENEASRDDLKQLRLKLLQKIKQAEAKKAVDVADVPGLLSIVSGPSVGPATRN